MWSRNQNPDITEHKLVKHNPAMDGLYKETLIVGKRESLPVGETV